MIKFRCPSCNQKMGFSEEYAGRVVRCTRCKKPTRIPQLEPPAIKEIAIEPVVETGRNPGMDMNTAEVFLDSMWDDFEQEKTIDAAAASRQEPISQTQPPDKHTKTSKPLPWFIDVFLFPLNAAGLVMLAMFVFGPMALDLVFWFMGLLLRHLGPIMLPIIVVVSLISFLIMLVFMLYLLWYLTVCVEQSASGQRRGPEVLSCGGDDNFWDTFMRLVRLIASVVICLSGGAIYYQRTERIDGLFWLIQLSGAFFLPMAILSVIMNESIVGLNPIRIIISILKTLPQYCAIVLIFYISIAAMVTTVYCLRGANVFLGYIGYSVTVYLLFVASHIIGRHYDLNETRLDWF